MSGDLLSDAVSIRSAAAREEAIPRPVLCLKHTPRSEWTLVAMFIPPGGYSIDQLVPRHPGRVRRTDVRLSGLLAQHGATIRTRLQHRRPARARCRFWTAMPTFFSGTQWHATFHARFDLPRPCQLGCHSICVIDCLRRGYHVPLGLCIIIWETAISCQFYASSMSFSTGFSGVRRD